MVHRLQSQDTETTLHNWIAYYTNTPVTVRLVFNFCDKREDNRHYGQTETDTYLCILRYGLMSSHKPYSHQTILHRIQVGPYSDTISDKRIK